MIEIFTDKPRAFNEYLLGKIKADLKKSAFFFNPSFFFRGKEYTLIQCIESLNINKNRITYSLLMQVKHLIYNNRQLFWKDILLKYASELDREYLTWRGIKQHSGSRNL